MKNRCCENCRFIFIDEFGYYRCRRYPVYMRTNGSETPKDGWCGEYKRDYKKYLQVMWK